MQIHHLIHLLVEKVDALVQVLSQLVAIGEVVVKLMLEKDSMLPLVRETEEEKFSVDKPYAEEELMTVKEAMAMLVLSRCKIEDFIRKDELLVIRKGVRGVRLIRKQVEAKKLSYSVKKGKI